MQNVNYNPNVNTNFVSTTTNLNSNQNVLSIEEKNARLQEVEKTPFSQIVKEVKRLRSLSPLWEMAQEGIDISKIQWASH